MRDGGRRSNGGKRERLLSLAVVVSLLYSAKKNGLMRTLLFLFTSLSMILGSIYVISKLRRWLNSYYYASGRGRGGGGGRGRRLDAGGGEARSSNEGGGGRDPGNVLTIEIRRSRSNPNGTLYAVVRDARTGQPVPNIVSANLALMLQDRDFTANDYEILASLDDIDEAEEERRRQARRETIAGIIAAKLEDCASEESEGLSMCSVCLDALKCEFKRVRKCKHAFHSECITKWLERNPKCPVCRCLVMEEES